MARGLGHLANRIVNYYSCMWVPTLQRLMLGSSSILMVENPRGLEKQWLASKRATNLYSSKSILSSFHLRSHGKVQ